MPTTMTFGGSTLVETGLTPVSQLLLRSKPDWLQAGILLVNPPRDSLMASLPGSGVQPALWCLDYAQCEYHGQYSDQLADIIFTAQPETKTRYQQIILFQPREKALLDYLSAALSGCLREDGNLWLVGEKRAGINSSSKYLKNNFGQVKKWDAARHCSLYQASAPIRQDQLSLTERAIATIMEFRGHTHRLLSLPGTFSHGELDPASELLLESLEQNPPGGQVLDFGCGNGVLGFMASLVPGVAAVELIDSNAFAIASATLNAPAYSNVRVYPSNGFSRVQQPFDLIISNPPFHRGIHTSLDTSIEMIRRAPEYLHKKGELRIVANRHLPYYRELCESFKRVTTLLENRRFIVYRAVR